MIFVLIFLINLSFSEVNEYNKVTLDLNTAIQMMIDNNGMYGASKKTIDYAKAKIEEARAAWYPKTEVTYLIAPIFEETGNALASNSDYSKWGVFTKIYGTVVQPLYTFGLISSYKSAALAYYDLEVARSNLTKNELVDQTKQFFYGLQLAYELIDVVEDAKSKLEGAIKTAEEKVLRNKMKREDLFALKTYNAKILTKVDEANRGKYLAKQGLAWILGLGLNTEVELEKPYIDPEKVEIKSEDYYIDLATKYRPEIKMIDSGLLATKNLWQAETFKKRPNLFLIGFGEYSYSNVRENQKSPFANDPYNNLGAGVALGLRFNLDWWSINAKAKQSKAQYEQLFVSKNTLTDGMKLQIKKAYRELIDCKKNLEYTEEGQKNAKKWFFSAIMGYSMGFTETDSLVKSLEAYFEAILNYYLAIYQFNVTLSNLTKVVGQEVVPSIKYE